MAYINFYRGVRDNYTGTDSQQDCIYFATDTRTILMNGAEYGVSGEVANNIEQVINSGIVDVTFNSPNNIVFKNLEGTEIANITIPDATTSTSGLMTAEDKSNLEKAISDIGEVNTKVEEIEQSVESNISGLTLEYSLSTKLIELKNNEGTVISSIDATDFIKDGMLDSASLEVNPSGQSEGTYILLTFNTDAGKENIYVNVTSLVDVYTAGNGISIDNNIVSVKIASSSESFLTVTEDGVAVSGIQDAITNAVQGVVSGDISQILNYTVNSKAISTNPVLDGSDIALTGYTDTDLISSTNTINEAIAKLDNQLIWTEV